VCLSYEWPYGRAPRGLYYALLLFVILLRRQDWLTAGAAAACLTYGGSAAIHAMILTPILSLGRTAVPNGVVQLSNSTQVKVDAALVADLDSDATLAIVGAGFLIAMPMAIWSAQFRHSGAVPILVMWILLMFIGMVCCMTILNPVESSSTGPLRQFRFCNLGYNDTLPFSGNSINVVNNSWNDTVWSYFSNQYSSSPGCFYPCLNASGLLRQPGDARVIESLDINPSKPIYWGIELISTIIYLCVPLSIAFSLTILVLRLRGYASAGWDFDSSEKIG
jgi:hypothetical protein